MSKRDCYDVVVVGGGASGLMCASQAAARGLDVLVLEKGPKVGLKILVSGGGRCNFTNLYADPQEQFLSENPHFCISAMRRYQVHDFIALVESHGISYHEKKLGQLFCDDSAKQIAAMLLKECVDAGAEVLVGREVLDVMLVEDVPVDNVPVEDVPDSGHPEAKQFTVHTDTEMFYARKVVLASGGLSLPKIASDIAFRVARSCDLAMVDTRPALVPLTWNGREKEGFSALSGISVDAEVSAGNAAFRENILFTHRGLSGPAILQASSYWREGASVYVDLLPEIDASSWLCDAREQSPQLNTSTWLKQKLPKRLVEHLAGDWFVDQKCGSATPAELRALGERLNGWEFKPGGSEGYRTAEVTLGGIDTNEVSSKTFEVTSVPGLYAVGEALDVTGWLGGYNFQWAWASGWCCGQHL